jgi:glycerol-3-phosphate dehydrogenase
VIGRDLQRAATERFDLVVVGGGILGATTALLAASRGLATVLVERGDFGGGATWNSLRILHGGLRSLQRLDLSGHRDAARESAALSHAFPELVEPLACVLPLDGRGTWRRPLAAAAVAAESVLARSRSAVGARPRLVGAAELRRLHPGGGGARAGLVWHDALLARPGRLVVETLRWAASAGAVALSRVEALRPLVSAGRRIEGIAARDLVSGSTLELRARAVGWCAGAPCPAEEAGEGSFPGPARVLAFNLLLARQLPRGRALAVRSPRGPAFFLVPLAGVTLAGTRYVTATGIERPSGSDVERFVVELAAAAPFLALEPGAVLRVLAGHQPAAAPGKARPATRAVHHDHSRPPGPRGLHCAWPVKLTTARREAERLLRRLAPDLGTVRIAPRPEPLHVPGPEEATRLAADDPAVLAAVAARLVTEEAVLAGDDLLLRRTDWALDPRRSPLLEAALAGILSRLPSPGSFA